MSSFVCVNEVCTFTRVDTNGSFYGQPTPYYTLPPTPIEDSIRDPAFNNTIAPWTDEANQDLIGSKVAITRDVFGGIFNALVENDQYNVYTAPTGTEWALLPEGKTFEEARCSLMFCGWLDCFAQYDIKSRLNKAGVVHLIEEDLYYNIMFTNWTHANGDSSYRRLQEEQKEYPTEEIFSGQGFPVGPDYGGYGSNAIGGGFQYVRDEFPIAYDDSLECPNCQLGKASPEELKGPVDNKFQEVSVTGVTPADVVITITAVSQDSNPRCNKEINGTIRRNAMGIGNSTVELRRTIIAGQLSPFRYTVFFNATSQAGSCIGQVYVCSAPEGLDCNSYYGYDATATEFCEFY